MKQMFKDDGSLSADSVFDWGSLPSGAKTRDDGISTLSSAEGRTKSGKKHFSRYDPKGLNRITDITDLVDNDSDSDDDAVVGSHNAASMEVATGAAGADAAKRRHRLGFSTTSLCFRQAVALLSIVAIVAAASLAIGYAVVRSDPPERGGAPPVEERQQLLETAERVVVACGEAGLREDPSECPRLCESSMCCFRSGGGGDCEADPGRDCAVYAGCEALLEGKPEGGMEEGEG